MAGVRAALGQLADGVGIGILGLNRSCWGASTSGLAHEPLGLGLRWLRSLTALGPDSGLHALEASKTSLPYPQPSRPSPAASPHGSAGSPLSAISVRGYKSNKRSLKPLNTAASWQAVQPLLLEERQRQQLEQPGPDGAPSTRRLRPLGPILDTCLPPIPEVPVPAEFTRVGVITGQYSLKPERVFGVVQLAGTQFKVTTDDIIFVNQLPGVEVNDVLALDRVMLLGSRSQTIVGRPYVPGATVLAAVEEHFRDGKVHVFKMKKRKRYMKYQGPRPNLMTLRILQVRGIDPAPGDELAMLPEIPVAPTHPHFGELLSPLGLPAGEEQEGEEQQQEEAVQGGR